MARKKKDKINWNIIGLGFFLLLIIIAILFFGSRNTALVGIGQDYSITTENGYQITFNMYDEYWEKTGCKENACESSINGCNLQSTKVSELMGCPIYDCKSTGTWDSCEGTAADVCGYGKVCSQTWSYRCGTRTCACSNYCTWRAKDYGTKGGVVYSDFDNCAWKVLIKANGTVVKDLSQVGKYGVEWAKTGYYRDEISYTGDDYTLKYMSSEYGITQRRTDGSTIKSCLNVKFQMDDERYRYNICLGNDGLDAPGCSEVETKQCILSCPSPQKMNPDTCECEGELPDPNEPGFKIDSKILIIGGLVLVVIIIAAIVIIKNRGKKHGKK